MGGQCYQTLKIQHFYLFVLIFLFVLYLSGVTRPGLWMTNGQCPCIFYVRIFVYLYICIFVFVCLLYCLAATVLWLHLREALYLRLPQLMSSGRSAQPINHQTHSMTAVTHLWGEEQLCRGMQDFKPFFKLFL